MEVATTRNPSVQPTNTLQFPGSGNSSSIPWRQPLPALKKPHDGQSYPLINFGCYAMYKTILWFIRLECIHAFLPLYYRLQCCWLCVLPTPAFCVVLEALCHYIVSQAFANADEVFIRLKLIPDVTCFFALVGSPRSGCSQS